MIERQTTYQATLAKVFKSVVKGVILSQFIYYCDETEDNKIDKPFSYWKDKLGVNREEWQKAIKTFCDLEFLTEKRDEKGNIFYLLDKGKTIELLNSKGIQIEVSVTRKNLPLVQVLSSSQSKYKEGFDKFAWFIELYKANKPHNWGDSIFLSQKRIEKLQLILEEECLGEEKKLKQVVIDALTAIEQVPALANLSVGWLFKDNNFVNLAEQNNRQLILEPSKKTKEAISHYNDIMTTALAVEPTHKEKWVNDGQIRL